MGTIVATHFWSLYFNVSTVLQFLMQAGWKRVVSLCTRVCHKIKKLSMKKGPMKSRCINVWRNRIRREKFDFLFFPYLLFHFKNSRTPLWAKKKILPIIGFMVLKTTGLSPRFQCKNWFWKICIGSRDIGKKVAKFCRFAWKAKFGYIFANISGLGTYFSKPIFALKPWV